jgi:hypothetical protein
MRGHDHQRASCNAFSALSPDPWRKGSGRGADEPPTGLSPAKLEGEAAEGAQEVETAEERTLSNFVYYEIRDGLIAQGVRRDEIAFIHDCATKTQRDALFAAVNEGRVRVLIGSTTKDLW